ncbi:MAG: hypothetical protein FWG36_02880 [Oscillospiraceae bacterium]|nr:hypothetical protein [Oscillospiraceae bacterium]
MNNINICVLGLSDEQKNLIEQSINRKDGNSFDICNLVECYDVCCDECPFSDSNKDDFALETSSMTMNEKEQRDFNQSQKQNLIIKDLESEILKLKNRKLWDRILNRCD